MTFPCDFPIKIMGERRDDFAQLVLAIVQKHAPDFTGENMEIRASVQSRYLSVTCTIRATSRAQIDGLYRELTSNPMIKFVL